MVSPSSENDKQCAHEFSIVYDNQACVCPHDTSVSTGVVLVCWFWV